MSEVKERADGTHGSGWLGHFLANPCVGATGALASIISIPLAFYFYRLSERHPNLLVVEGSARSAIVRAGSITDVRVLYREKPVTGDLSVVRIAFWNQGKGAIRPTNVLSPLRYFKAGFRGSRVRIPPSRFAK